jgi:hypothetical protein
MNKLTALLVFSMTSLSLIGQDTIKPAKENGAASDEKPKTEEKKSHWYEKMAIRGYTQVRYNRMFETNADLVSEQGDKSIGNNGGFFIRRMRIIFFGQVHDHVYFYIQPDFASSVGTTGHIAQLRDAYFDVSLDKNREFRFRIGQSKVPFGFENLQSSQNRLPLDRNDALNSALSNERDLGVFFMYAPKKIRSLYSSLVNDGYKGSGDYGIFAAGLYNGQTANKSEANNNSHFVARVSYPFTLGNQVIEPGVQGYTGLYVVDGVSSGTKFAKNREYLDERYAASLVLYPKPFGIQAEYNLGKGPEYDAGTDSIMTKDLKGGYVTLNYMIRIKKQFLFPFVRFTTYEGGKKHEVDARSYRVDEVEAGFEYQPVRNFELVLAWMYSDRRTSDRAKENNYQFGSLLRVQAQLNF